MHAQKIIAGTDKHWTNGAQVGHKYHHDEALVWIISIYNPAQLSTVSEDVIN